ncbi:MAG: hypothetical protein Ta2A_02220 [Treponemataceae bacterium]|nr:MAG: hypothetical protein Ta2A_02220 [Treponemataceae bacterium]
MDGESLRTLLSDNIKRFRAVYELSQAELAEKANISVPFLSAIECGNKWPHPDTLARIAVALNVEVYDLFKPENAVTHDIRTITTQLAQDVTALLNESVVRIESLS